LQIVVNNKSEANDSSKQPEIIGSDASSTVHLEDLIVSSYVKQNKTDTETEETSHDETLIASSNKVAAVEKQVLFFTLKSWKTCASHFCFLCLCFFIHTLVFLSQFIVSHLTNLV
jgi:hypothetical protein